MAKNKNGAKYLLVEVPDEHLRNVLRLNKKESRNDNIDRISHKLTNTMASLELDIIVR